VLNLTQNQQQNAAATVQRYQSSRQGVRISEANDLTIDPKLMPAEPQWRLLYCRR
jgi:hypothetical protein